jgi:hypothetical protein
MNATEREPLNFMTMKAHTQGNGMMIARNAMEMESLKRKLMMMMKFEIRFFNVCGRTFKRKATKSIIQAYDTQHALRIVDRHLDLIISIRKL